jgi:hypothetical protein
MPPRVPPSRIAQALEYLQGLKSGVGEFVGGVGSNLADRAKAAGGLAYEALTSDPNMGRMNTAEFSEAAANRAPTPRLDATAQGIGALGKALVTQPVQTAKAVVVDPIVNAFESPRAMGQFAGSMVDPLRLAAALRRGPMLEMESYQGSPQKVESTPDNPLGELDASKVGTGEGAQALEAASTEMPSRPSMSFTERKTAAGRTALKNLHKEQGVKYKDWSFERGGAHSPAGPDSGSPAFDVTMNGTYPDDFYGMNGLRYYGTGYDALDSDTYSTLSRLAGRPNAFVTVYRAVEKDAKGKINPGDWVTTSRAYAKEHGQGALNNNFKIVKNTVRARDIWTAGDSMLEWGYHPQEFLPEIRWRSPSK